MSSDVITIDGPSGTGKGTLCAMLAAHLGWHQLDSGVIYRVLAWEVMQRQLDVNQTEKVVEAAKALDFHFGRLGQIYWQQQEVTREIRTEPCGQLASKISVMQPVRAALLERQRAFLQPPGLVTDGRDMGTVVFPEATIKFFLTASEQERVRRRFEQLKEQEICVSLAQVEAELKERDKRDSSRLHSPLKPASDAILLDTTSLTVSEVFARMLKVIKKYGIGGGDSFALEDN